MLVLGGDGIFLWVVELVCNVSILVLGVNLGCIGFLVEVEVEVIDVVFEYVVV